MNWLELYCGEGCVADGLIEAGDTVIGIDINKRAGKYYPGRFVHMDVADVELRRSTLRPGVMGFEVAPGEFVRIHAIWASPPCLRDTEMAHAPGAKGKAHPDLITPTRAFLQASGLPYVLENVPNAPLIDPVCLCGTMFKLGVSWQDRWLELQRHRHFETNWPLKAPSACDHRGPAVTAIGAHARIRSKSAGGRGTADFVGFPGGHRAALGEAFDIEPDRNITCKGITDGIPPAYARYIAQELHKWMSVTPSSAAAASTATA